MLSRNGHADLVATMLRRRDYPSLGYMLAAGATTFWELWNGDTAPPAMNSWNHIMLAGDFVTWLHEDLVGIAVEAPGFARLRIRPTPCGGITAAAASRQTHHGPVTVAWNVSGGRFTLDLVLPPDTEAILQLPVAPVGLTERGRPLAASRDIRKLGSTEGRVQLGVGSGVYRFAGEASV